VVLGDGVILDDDLGAGAGLFRFTGAAGGTLTGTGSSPGVAAGQVVTIASSDVGVGLATNLTNAGTITLGDAGSGYSLLGGAPLTNTGVLRTVSGGGGGRLLRLNVTNAAGGNVDIAGPTLE